MKFIQNFMFFLYFFLCVFILSFCFWSRWTNVSNCSATDSYLSKRERWNLESVIFIKEKISKSQLFAKWLFFKWRLVKDLKYYDRWWMRPNVKYKHVQQCYRIHDKKRTETTNGQKYKWNENKEQLFKITYFFNEAQTIYIKRSNKIVMNINTYGYNWWTQYTVCQFSFFLVQNPSSV